MSEFHYVRTQGDDGGVSDVDGPAAGLDLETILKDGLPPFKVALEIVAAMCEILDITTEDEQTHGDITLRDVFIDETGAVSIEGFGVPRTRSAAPEGSPRGPATDLFGLGSCAYRLFTPHPVPEFPDDDPDLHDDGIVDAVLNINFEGLNEEMTGDVQWYVAKLMSFDREDRPDAVEAWRTFIAFADTQDGPFLDEWAGDAMRGGGERRDMELAAKSPLPPEEDEDLGGPVVSSGPLSKGAISFGAAGAQGGATAFWNKDAFKAALDGEEEDDDGYKPAAGGGAATAFWSRDQLQAMAEGRDDAVRPKRQTAGGGAGGGRPAPRKGTEVTQDRPIPEAPKTDFIPTAPPPPPPPRHQTEPTHPVSNEPVTTKDIPLGGFAGVGAGGVADSGYDPGGYDAGGYDAYDDEDEGGGSGLMIGVVVVLLLVVCGGVLSLGAGYWYINQGESTDATFEAPDIAPEPVPVPANPVPVPEVEPEPEPAPNPSPSPRPTPRPQPSSSPSPSPSPSPRPSASPSPSPRPSASPSPSPRPSTRPRPAPAPEPEPEPTDGPATVDFRSAARGSVRCSSSTDFDGNTSLSFQPYELPATCMVTIDGKRGVFQVYGSGKVTCNPSGTAVSCTPSEVK